MNNFAVKYSNSLSGVAATEFALVVPVLMTLLIGTIDAGMFINEKMKVESAARVSVEYLLNQGGEEYIVEDIMSLYFQPKDETEDEDLSWQDDIEVETGYVCECAGGEEISCTDTCYDPGDYRRRFIHATVSKTYDTIIPYPGLPSSVPITGHARIQKD